MKRALSLILVFASVLTLFASCKSSKPRQTEDGKYEYVVLEDDTAKITKYLVTENVIELNIPASVDEYTVTVIGKEAFKGVQTITVVNTPDTLTTIEPYAFANSSVKKAFMHRSKLITTIGEYAFAECANLIQVDMPRSLTSLGDYAFHNCTNLKIAFFRGDTEKIGAYSFDACPKVKIYTYDNSTNVLGYLDTYPTLGREIKPAPGLN